LGVLGGSLWPVDFEQYLEKMPLQVGGKFGKNWPTMLAPDA
jgi:hypothetical protein